MVIYIHLDCNDRHYYYKKIRTILKEKEILQVTPLSVDIYDKKKVSATSCCSLSLICLISADTLAVEWRVGAQDRRWFAILC